MIGRTLSHYKVIEKIGQGGMGEVYRAEDTSLKREVAIKVLPEQFTKDPQRLARFEREAQLLASLNHPNIAAIHSFEHAEDIHFLVLELVPGETLAERVATAPLPVEEALGVCRQIAEGMEAAHEKGVIHRDLKPANVKVTPEGKVKILDFGLAKAFEAETPVTDISQSPTLTQAMTQAGVILGTAAYMSPEQARGKSVDKRADIWAFGCLLYECLTGQRAFGGETITDVLAAIIHKEPNWEALPEKTAWRVRDLLCRCLQKDPHDRVHEIADVRIEIKLALEEPFETGARPVEAPGARSPWRPAIAFVLTALVAATLTAVGVWNLIPNATRPLARMVITLSPSEELDFMGETALSEGAVAFSPDGTRLVYVADRGNARSLYLRPMDRLEAKPIPGTEGATSPFFSPDGQWIGFFADGVMKKVPINGGNPVVVADAPAPRGASWGPENTIVFAPSTRTGLHLIPATGGTPQVLTSVESKKGETSHRWPHFLPGGRAVLFTMGATGRWDDALIVVQSLDTGDRRVLVEGGTYARYVPTGHLVYAREGRMMAVPFDLARLEVTGNPVPVVEGVALHQSNGASNFSFSDGGWLAFVAGGAIESLRTLLWVDPQGTVQPLTLPPGTWGNPRLSPDGQRLAVFMTAEADIWIYDISGDALNRLTFEGANDNPIWTPDGKRITFASNRTGSQNLFWKSADGSGAAEQLTTSEHVDIASSWSPDGNLLAFSESDPTSGWDIWILPIEGERKPQPFLQSPFDESAAVFSPDGRWLAYQSNESGRLEIYVQTFPDPAGKWQISTEGGREPVWARSGQQLFYRNDSNQTMAVEIVTEPTFTSRRPRLLLEEQYAPLPIPSATYDVAADGRFIVAERAGLSDGSARTQIHLVLNWFEELKRLVPTN